MDLKCKEDDIPDILLKLSSYVRDLQAETRVTKTQQDTAKEQLAGSEEEVFRLRGEVEKLQQEVAVLQTKLQQSREREQQRTKQVNILTEELSGFPVHYRSAKQASGQDQQAVLGVFEKDRRAESLDCKVQSTQLLLEQPPQNNNHGALQGESELVSLPNKACCLEQDLMKLQQRVVQEQKEKDAALQGKARYKKDYKELADKYRLMQNAYIRLRKEKGYSRGAGSLLQQTNPPTDGAKTAEGPGGASGIHTASAKKDTAEAGMRHAAELPGEPMANATEPAEQDGTATNRQPPGEAILQPSGIHAKAAIPTGKLKGVPCAQLRMPRQLAGGDSGIPPGSTRGEDVWKDVQQFGPGDQSQIDGRPAKRHCQSTGPTQDGKQPGAATSECAEPVSSPGGHQACQHHEGKGQQLQKDSSRDTCSDEGALIGGLHQAPSLQPLPPDRQCSSAGVAAAAPLAQQPIGDAVDAVSDAPQPHQRMPPLPGACLEEETQADICPVPQVVLTTPAAVGGTAMLGVLAVAQQVEIRNGLVGSVVRQQLDFDVAAAPAWSKVKGRGGSGTAQPLGGGPVWKTAARPSTAAHQDFCLTFQVPTTCQPARQDSQEQIERTEVVLEEQVFRANGCKENCEDAGDGRFKYQEVVRKRSEREKLKGVECIQCRRFYEALQTWRTIGSDHLPECGHISESGGAVAGQPMVSREQLRQAGSRHRYRHEPPATPQEFWNMDFTP